MLVQVLRVALVFSLGVVFSSESWATTLSGYWETESGATYEFVHDGNSILAIYDRPTQSQKDTGVVKGDIAYKGDLIGKIIVGEFHHRFPLTDQKSCPGLEWYLKTTLYLAVSDDSNKLEGDLLLTHVNDSCEIDDRKMDHLIFSRIE